jgi:hypothetical protein
LILSKGSIGQLTLRKECGECHQRLAKSESLASELDEAKNQILALKKEEQSEELKWYKEENTFMATQVFELLDKFEQGSKSHHDLLKECDRLKKKGENSDSKFQSLLLDYERAVRWINLRKDSVKDYENCINNLDLAYILNISSPDQNGNILSTKVSIIMKEASSILHD